MGIDVFQINLNTLPNHVYRPGDIVSGSVQLNVSTDTDLSDGMTITIYGQAHVEWKQHNGNNTTTYTGNDEIFENSLIHSVSSDQTVYPFSMAIPNIPCLPWSAVTQYGRVEYGVKAVIKRPWFKMGNKNANVIFTLNSSVNSRVSSDAIRTYCDSVTTSNSDDTRAGCCCFPFCCWYMFSSEAVKMNLNITSLWTYPGEDVHFTLEVDNTGTKRELGGAKVQLIGIWTHSAQCRVVFGSAPYVEKETESVFNEEVIPMRILPGEAQTQKGKLKVPMDVMPTQVDCKVLKLTYKLRGVLDEISGFRCIKMPATVEVDILIGTIKANETTVLNENVY